MGHDEAQYAIKLSRQISLKLQPMLKGHPPEFQGAVLADLAAVWLAGHAPVRRETILNLHVGHIRLLISINEKIIFGEQGHPAGKD